MRIPASCFCAILAPLLIGSIAQAAAAALPPEGNTASAGVNFQGIADGTHTDFKPHPGLASSLANAGPGTAFSFFNEPVAVSEQARAEARASSLPGSIGSYSHAGGGFSFNPANPSVIASAFARQVTYWRAVSSDPAITVASIDLTPIYDGSLFVSDGGPSVSFANVSAVIFVRTTGSSSLVYNANATLFESGLIANGSAAWTTSFVEKTLPPTTFGERYFEMAYAELLPSAFSVPVNETYAFDSQLFTEARAPNAFEAWAISNFLNSGSFEMQTSTPGVTLVAVSAPIPWPAPIWLWLTGGACLSLYRSRKAA